MKILAIGDLHGDLEQAKKLAEKAKKEKVDLVVFNGDFTFAGMQTPGLFKTFKDKGLKIAILPGNHESPDIIDFIKYKYGITNLHGYGLQFGDVGLFGCGSANIGLFQLPEDEIYNVLKEGFNKVMTAKKKIMFTHMHPDETLLTKFSGFKGSKAIKKAIERFKPDILISSHIHEAEGLEDNIGSTKILSVGPRGKIIEI
ncbi:MAG: metallophosphoesterase [Candidatus Nanoarchaeia archaeon]